LKSFSSELFIQFNTVFQTLLIAAMIDQSIFYLHDGISPHPENLEEFERLHDLVEGGLLTLFGVIHPLRGSLDCQFGQSEMYHRLQHHRSRAQHEFS
jgi:hypothetical protein